MTVEVAQALAFLPPWVALAALLGVINGSACFMLLGQRITRLGWYAAIGAPTAALGHVFGAATQAPAPVLIGEVNVVTASLATWIILSAAWAAGVR